MFYPWIFLQKGWWLHQILLFTCVNFRVFVIKSEESLWDSTFYEFNTLFDCLIYQLYCVLLLTLDYFLSDHFGMSSLLSHLHGHILRISMAKSKKDRGFGPCSADSIQGHFPHVFFTDCAFILWKRKERLADLRSQETWLRLLNLWGTRKVRRHQ